jgi:hypothetical protein
MIGKSVVAVLAPIAQPRHCEERSDEAIQGHAKILDCFASLAMTFNFYEGEPPCA